MWVKLSNNIVASLVYMMRAGQGLKDLEETFTSAIINC